MSLSAWLPFFLVCLFGAMSPGPSLAVVIQNTLKGSRAHGVATAVAHSLGIGSYALVATTGLAVLIINSPQLFHLLTWGGAAYLFWLGVSALRAGKDVQREVTGVKTDITLLQAARQGFLISFLNPKAVIFFVALFSQFVHPGANLAHQSIMVITPIVVDALWFSLVALTISQPRIFSSLEKQFGLLNKVTGVILILIAVKILFL